MICSTSSNATAALAYCDAFFTEKSLRTIVTQKHIALDRLYGCHVVASVDDAIAYTSGLAKLTPVDF